MQLFYTILEREYFNIVKRRAFWLTTFLLPLGIALLFGIQIAAFLFAGESEATVWVMKESQTTLAPALVSGNSITYKTTTLSKDSLLRRVESNKNEFLLVLPEKSLLDKKEISFPLYHGAGNVSESVKREIEKRIHKAIYEYKRQSAGITEAQLAQLTFSLSANTQRVTKTGNKGSSTAMATALAFMMNFLMYMLVMIYGTNLMQSVIEEKNNRIVEIIISSVEPFTLLMGKIIAVALAGLTQFLLWVVLSMVIVFGMSFILGFSLLGSGAELTPAAAGGGVDPAMAESLTREIIVGIRDFNWHTLWLFPLYFLGGFFLIGSLFAAVGASVDNIQDAQQFVTPLTMTMVLPMLFIQSILQNPNSAFATFCSLFPFFSPMIMMARMALTEVPWYEVVLSLLLLAGAFIGGVWVSARIYRVGILMYGKKPTYKELIKWIRA